VVDRGGVESRSWVELRPSWLISIQLMMFLKVVCLEYVVA
jgi:hypothetical protein